MASRYKYFIKHQGGNLLICLFVFLISTYFNYVNSIEKQHILVQDRYTNINQLLDHHIMFMKHIPLDFLQTHSYPLTYVDSLIETIKQSSSNHDQLGIASKWLSLFNHYLLDQNSESLTDYSIIKQNYHALLSAITRYNLEANRYNALLAKKPFNLVFFNRNLDPIRIVMNPILSHNAFEIVL